MTLEAMIFSSILVSTPFVKIRIISFNSVITSQQWFILLVELDIMHALKIVDKNSL